MDTPTCALKDFDIALSLNERAVGRQLKRAWDIWTDADTGTPFTLDVTPLNVRNQPSTTHLTARLASPALSLSAERTASKEVCTTLTLLDGTLTYVSDGETVELPIHNYALSIRSLLRKRSVTWTQLYNHDAECADDVREHVDAYRLGEGQFSIECLFLTLTGREALMIPQVQAGNQPGLSIEAHAKLVECIATWVAASGVDGPNGLLLSASVVPRAAKRAPSLSMADYAFRLNRQYVSGIDRDLTHTIDYLGVAVGGNTLPGDDEAQDALCRKQGTWPHHAKADGSTGLFAGVMVLRKDLFINHLLQSLNQALQREASRMAEENRLHSLEGKLKHPELDFLQAVSFVREGDSLFLQGRKHYQWTDNDLKLGLDKELKLELKLAGSQQLKLEGQLYGHLDRDRTTSWDMHSRAKATRNTQIGGSFTFVIEGEGAKCSVVPQFSLNFTPLRGDNDDEGDTWGITQFFTRINNDWDVQVAGDWLSASRDAIIGMLEGVFRDVNLAMGNFAFIPPGEESFSFRNPQLNEHLDLVIDVIYRGV